jgi:cell division septal protein FtsQ
MKTGTGKGLVLERRSFLVSRQDRVSRHRIRRLKGRRPTLRIWAGRLGRAAVTLAMLGSLGFLGVNLYQYIHQMSNLNVREIKIAGCVHTTESELLHIAGVNFQASLLRLDLAGISRRLSQHPWVEKVRVKRDWPRRALIIDVQERVPEALILLEDLHFLDNRGRAFKRAEWKDRLDFPILTGLTPKEVAEGDPGAAELIRNALEFLTVLKEGKAFTLREISEIHLSRSRGITLIALNGTSIRLGSGEFAEKIARLEKVLPDLEQKMKQVEYVDLNYPKKVVVKMRTPEKEKSRKA